jgi:hypothetical protein
MTTPRNAALKLWTSLLLDALDEDDVRDVAEAIGGADCALSMEIDAGRCHAPTGAELDDLRSVRAGFLAGAAKHPPFQAQ